MILYRPVGLFEMLKILESRGKEFPPRLAEQPIFYPVVNYEYAKQISEKWNTKDRLSGNVGFITEFEIDDTYISNYELHQVGNKEHIEYWIPSSELPEFNKHIIKNIVISNGFYGNNYAGITPKGVTGFRESDPEKQLSILESLLNSNYMDFSGTLSVEWEIANINYFLWKKSCDNKQLLDMIFTSLTKNRNCYIKDEC